MAEPEAPIATAASAWRAGIRASFGPQSAAMMATFLAFGAACRGADMPIAWMLASCVLVYGMPGQMILLAVPGLPGVMGATVANARFLPMAVTLAPYLGPRGWMGAHFIAVTPWVVAIRHLPGVHPRLGLAWFLGCGSVACALGTMAAVVGFYSAGALPASMRAGLLYANAFYFALLMAGDLARPAVRPAVVGGILAAPLALLLPPAEGLLLAGLVGGTGAWLWRRMRP
ncbi:putative branched-subunit amino acid permease [Humitalea rosea]|uniref:Putative branched-subunit amino acid permease n=1 Tax=Humitalea rosea TaxID=990373 RepID=A0A2W7INV2_9PROT|nr:AzlC family ABC transporter permease [Humitalea rosea]PZW47048.1 putative branched-subunit amino acid permease [Humitalea rosea]